MIGRTMVRCRVGIDYFPFFGFFGFAEEVFLFEVFDEAAVFLPPLLLASALAGLAFFGAASFFAAFAFAGFAAAFDVALACAAFTSGCSSTVSSFSPSASASISTTSDQRM